MNEDLNIKKMNYENGVLDMSLTGESAKIFMMTLVEFFKQNGGENYLTLTLSNDTDKYAITIENCNGKDTPAEKIARLEQQVKDLQNK